MENPFLRKLESNFCFATTTEQMRFSQKIARIGQTEEMLIPRRAKTFCKNKE